MQEKIVNPKVYWRCTKYTTSVKCHGRVHTIDGKIVKESSGHNHPFLTIKNNK